MYNNMTIPCPEYVLIQRPVIGFHNLINLSPAPVAIYEPSLLNLAVLTVPVCSLRVICSSVGSMVLEILLIFVRFDDPTAHY